MSIINKDSFEAILRPFKNKINNLVDKNNATVNNTISINNNDTIAKISAEQDSARLSIGSHHLDFTKNGELKINDVNIHNKNY